MMQKVFLFFGVLIACHVLTGSVSATRAGKPEKGADFRVANIFQSNMVVQQNKPMAIWGWAGAHQWVRITASWNAEEVMTKSDADGYWIGSLNVPAARRGDFSPQSIRFVQGHDSVLLGNILIGDVWICSGQSNMAYEMDTTEGGKDGVIDFATEIAKASYPSVRLFTMGRAWEQQPQADCRGEWKVCSPQTVGKFSAVGYYFGKMLFDSLQIPVGLIDNSMPAAACQSFTSQEVLTSDERIKEKYYDPYMKNPHKEGESILAVLQRPSLIYNGMFNPVKNLSISGFIWYQGESNRRDGMMYARLCSAMLAGWRHDFGQGNLPFYFVQLPPYGWGETDTTLFDYALLREAQRTLLQLDNTGMVVTMDVGDPTNIHPHNKKPIGLRLARVALNQTYGYKQVSFEGPAVERADFKGRSVDIIFKENTVGDGLQTNDNKPPRHFYVAGTDKIFHPATAVIKENLVRLSSPEVKHPVAVRYAFTNAPVTNLENSEGLPAEPFRIEKWRDAQ